MFPTEKFRPFARRAMAVVALGVIGVLTVGSALPASAAVLTPLPGNATEFQWSYQPYFDYDTDGCLPVAAIDNSGKLNGGLDDSGPVTGQCRSNHLGKANTYARSKCNNGWCAIIYALYFEKDMSCAGCTPTSHRHDWEGVVMWVPQDMSTPGFVSVSRHGQYETRSWNNVPNKSGLRVRAVYHKDGGSTHIMRFAGAGEQAEAWGNGGWDEPALLSWTNLRTDLRDKLNSASWGEANFPLKDDRFPTELSRAKPSGIAFNPNG
ncbi:NPP1 family protein [Kribbella albertanoniae]|uniref:Necrosis inducing protein (NPP1) n=1 Tax=Kribbella albertanoniae TaxID=1266829 RepID=A0A4R4Q2W5_9ACTN|nr:NPP1 family protein [Kribbella albertanoniae]TDC29347.1 necrosis inducing protein (NPP1) [Kribbella albertanoniae]